LKRDCLDWRFNDVIIPPSQLFGNPYVGPRPIRLGESNYGRELESREITDLLEAERVLLLYAPSGAGKTSLIQGPVAAILQESLSGNFRVSGPLRLNAVPPSHASVTNRYVWSVASELARAYSDFRLGSGLDPSAFEEMTLADLLDALESDSTGQEHVLIFDQFEEIVTLNPSDLEVKAEFFRQIRQVLQRPNRYMLFAIREEYMGGLDDYLRRATDLRARYRLNFLTHEAALRAIKLPAQDQGVFFSDEAANLLVTGLSTMMIEGRNGPVSVIGPYVEPLQLQVVCRSLWQRVHRERGERFTEIEAADVKRNVDIEGALGDFYSDAVHETAASTGASERTIREWIETQLITPQGLRSQSLTGPATGDYTLTEHVLRSLQDHYIIRSDARGGGTWYELSHDRLVPAVRLENDSWRHAHLSVWEIAANEWLQHNRDPSLLLHGSDVQDASRWLNDQGSAAREVEREFVRISREFSPHHLLRTRTSRLVAVVVVLVLIVVIETVLLLNVLSR
jgi:hypothetical protein